MFVPLGIKSSTCSWGCKWQPRNRGDARVCAGCKRQSRTARTQPCRWDNRGQAAPVFCAALEGGPLGCGPRKVTVLTGSVDPDLAYRAPPPGPRRERRTCRGVWSCALWSVRVRVGAWIGRALGCVCGEAWPRPFYGPRERYCLVQRSRPGGPGSRQESEHPEPGTHYMGHPSTKTCARTGPSSDSEFRLPPLARPPSPSPPWP